MTPTRFALSVALIAFGLLVGGVRTSWSAEPLQVGLAVTDITPPLGYPMSGYFHPRHATGVLDPLHAKAMVLRQGDRTAAIVVCDLLGIAHDLTQHVRRRAESETGIPADAIVLAATHSHTGPDYHRELFRMSNAELNDESSTSYVAHLVKQIVAAIVAANQDCRPAQLRMSTAEVNDLSFNRRFVMADGSIRTWANYRNPEVVRAAGPIDPQFHGLLVQDEANMGWRGAFTTFALHLDTTGGTELSADYPGHMQRILYERLGNSFQLLFAAGTCGDINHADPRATTRRTAQEIGARLAEAFVTSLEETTTIEPDLAVRSTILQLPLQTITDEDVAQAKRTLEQVAAGETVDMLKHVDATRVMRLDAFHHGIQEPATTTDAADSAGQENTRRPPPRKVSRSLLGIGDHMPVEVQVLRVGPDTAIVALPGEVFVDLGLSIKRHSPFTNTWVMELSNADDMAYIPTALGAQGGGYEVINSALAPGAGERLTAAAIELLRALRGQE